MRPSLRALLEAPTAAVADVGEAGVLVEWDASGTRQLYLAAPGAAPIQLTSLEQPVSGCFVPNGRPSVLVTGDEDGNERGQLHLLPFPRPMKLERVAVDAASVHRAAAVSRDGRLIAYASNARNGIDFDVVVRPLDSERRRRLELGGSCAPACFSPDGRLLAVLRRTERAGDDDLLLVDVGSGEVEGVLSHDEPARIGPPCWLRDGSGFFVSTNVGRELTAVGRYDLVERSFRYVVESEWDLTCGIDGNGRLLFVEANEDGYSRLELRDAATLAPLGDVPLPGDGVVESASFALDGSSLAFSFSSPREPADVWSYDVRRRRLERLTGPPTPLPVDDLVEPRLHRYRSFDGLEIPVFVYEPRGRGPFPVVISIHGGPESQARPIFLPWLQYLVGRGYAVAVPNVRGSTGYGKTYEHLDDGRRRLDAVADLVALQDWLRELPSIDARRAVLYGRSYGGYVVLAALAFHPERWAAGVTFVGISSLVTFLENTAQWRRRVREAEYGSLEHDRDFLHEISPLTHAHRIRAPLFVQHGANDPRVPLGEALQIVQALRERGIRCELAVYGDEGHALDKVENRVEAFERAAAFLDEVVAGSAADPAAQRG